MKRKRDAPEGPASSVNSHIWASSGTVNSKFRKLSQAFARRSLARSRMPRRRRGLWL